MAKSTLPTMLIGGYLGTGKTTLLNQILTQNHQKKFAVLVNDFGQINIDESLIQSHNKTLLNLKNGCICCSIGGALYDAIDQIIRIKDQIDVMIIEASGIAEPKNIANIAKAEPQLHFDGSLVLVDTSQIKQQLDNEYIKHEVGKQIEQAHLLILTKSELVSESNLVEIQSIIQKYAPDTTFLFKHELSDDILPLLDSTISSLKDDQTGEQKENHSHIYFNQTYSKAQFDTAEEMMNFLRKVPMGLLRAKGFIQIQDHNYLLQLVGRDVVLNKVDEIQVGLVFIGLKEKRESILSYLQERFI